MGPSWYLVDSRCLITVYGREQNPHVRDTPCVATGPQASWKDACQEAGWEFECSTTLKINSQCIFQYPRQLIVILFFKHALVSWILLFCGLPWEPDFYGAGRGPGSMKRFTVVEIKPLKFWTAWLGKWSFLFPLGLILALAFPWGGQTEAERKLIRWVISIIINSFGSPLGIC